MIDLKLQYHAEALEVVRRIEKSTWGTLLEKDSPLDSIKARFKPLGKGFSIYFQNDRSTIKRREIDLGEPYKNIPFTIKSGTIVLESVYLHHHSPPKFIGAVNSFYTIGYSKSENYYYRLIIPLEYKLQFHYSIEEHLFATNLGYRSRTGTKAKINDDEIFVSIIEDDNKNNFLSIESSCKQNFATFSEKAFAVKNGLGYLTGYMAGNKGYFFAYNDEEMKQPAHYYYSEFRNTINSGYVPIHTNPYSILRHDMKLAGDYYGRRILNTLNYSQFSTLFQRLHDSLEFTSVIMLMLESSVASLLFMPGGFAIALESLSDTVMGDYKEKLSPLANKTVSRKVRGELMEVLKTNEQLSPLHDWQTIKNRIEQINQVTNKARLRSPFNLLNIPLEQKDIEIIETRNDFLHGRIPDITDAGINRNTDRKNKDLYYAAMRFYTLLNMLILKWIGFDGYVVNHPKIQENFCKVEIQEEPYRKV